MLEELGDSTIFGYDYMSSSTGNDFFTLYFDSTGTKYIYTIYNEINISSVKVSVTSCSVKYFFNHNEVTTTLYDTVYNALLFQVIIYSGDNACASCAGSINLSTLPATIIDGDSSFTKTVEITNGKANFENFSVKVAGTYEFIIESKLFQDKITIANIILNKAVLKISLINSVKNI